VGIEFSVAELVRLRWLLLLGGGLQVGVTVGLATAITLWAGLPPARAVFLAMLLPLSSTAFVIRILTDRAELDTPHGRAVVPILIFQDLCVVPMVLLVPLLAGKSADFTSVAWILIKAVGFVGGALLAARYLVPHLLHLAVMVRRREIFLLTVLLLCLGAAWVSAAAGLSLALGAFVAGLILSQSHYSLQALNEMLPFREVFNSLFFTSIGLLLDPRVMLDSPIWVTSSVAAILFLKTAIAGGAVYLLGFPLRIAAAAALTLGQIGEFSFVLVRMGFAEGLIGPGLSQVFLEAAVITMGLTPLLHALAVRVAGLAGPLATAQVPWAGAGPGGVEDEPVSAEMADHVVVVGYGLNGRNLARVLANVGIPYVVLEMNPRTVAEERARGVPILYGDATSPETLAHAGVARARVAVVAISDPPSTRRIVVQAKRLNPGLHVIVRTRYVQEVQPIMALGAQEVIPEEFETSVEIFSRVLRRYLVPGEVISRSVEEVRQGAYRMLRAPEEPGSQRAETLERFLGGLSVEVLWVGPDCSVAGRTLGEARFRSTTGVTILAAQGRDGATRANPPSSMVLEGGELVLALGTREQINAATLLLSGKPGPSRAG
jgi:CPA2 family monovalent cation:H+ antiporter-2